MIKYWILDTFFKKEWLEAKRQGSIDAFDKAHADIRETMRDDMDKQAEELAKKKLNDLLSPTDLRGVVSLDKSGKFILINGEIPDKALIHNLSAEAKLFLESELWKLLYETPKAQAERAMFVEGENVQGQLAKGRTILYTLATQKNILDIFSSFKE